MNPKKTKIRLRQQPDFGVSFELFIYQEGESDEDFYPSRLVFEKADRNMNVEPTLILTMRETIRNNPLQELFDQMWQMGFRPSSGVSNAGQLQATQDHLEDMKNVAYDLLKRIKFIGER